MNPTIQISILAFVNLVLSFISQVLIAAFFGASGSLDAYIASTTIPFLLLTVFSGSLTYALVPQFVSIQSTETADLGAEFLRTALIGIGTFFLILAAILFVASPLLIRWTTPGFDEGRLSLATSLLKIQAPGLFFSSITAVLLSFHHSRRRFLLISSIPLIPPMAMIIGVLALGNGMGVLAIAVASLSASIVQASLLIPKGFFRGFVLFRFDASRFRTLMGKILPLVGGSIYFKTDSLVDRFLLSQSSGGTIASLWYSRKLIDASLSLSTTGIATSSFPAFSAHAAEQKREQFQQDLSYRLSLLAFIVLPIVMFLLACAEPVVHTLLERGQFKAQDTTMVASLLLGQLGVLLGGALGIILSNAFYALQDTRTPTVIGVAGFTLGILLKILLFGTWGVLGIALATSAYTVLNVVAELFFLRRSVFALRLGSFLRALVPITALSALALLPVYGVRMVVTGGALVTVLLRGFVYIASYWGLMTLFKVEIASSVTRKLLHWRQLL